MTDVEQADRFEKATTFDGDPEDPQDKMAQDAAKKNEKAGFTQHHVPGMSAPGLEAQKKANENNTSLANKDAASKISSKFQSTSNNVIKPITNKDTTSEPNSLGMNREQMDKANKQYAKQQKKEAKQQQRIAAEKTASDKKKAIVETPIDQNPQEEQPAPEDGTNKTVEQQPENQPTEQPQEEQQPSEEGGLKPESAEEGYENYLNDITDEEWDYTKKMLGDIGVAGMDALANAGEMLNKQYGALTALAGTALSGKPMSIASQAVTSTMTGLAAMNSFVDKTAQRSLGVKPGVSPEKLKDQLTVKGAGWYRDRDRAAAAEKYLTTRFDQAIKDAVGPDGDVSNIDDGQLEMISKRMREDMDPIMTRILAKPKEKRSMEDQAFMNAYQAMTRGVGKMSKQANSNARMVRKQFNQQAKEQSQQVKDLKAQANDREVWWNSYQNDPQNGLPPEIQKKMYNSFEQDRRMGKKLTPEQEVFMEDYDSNRYDFQKRNATIAWMGRNSNEYVLNVMRKRHNEALNAIKTAFSRYKQNPEAGFQPNNAEKRAIQNYSSLIEAYHKGGYDRKYPLDEDDKMLSEIFDEYMALDDPQILENIEKIAERPVKKSTAGVKKPQNAPIQAEKPQNAPIQTTELPKGEQNVLEEPKTIESPVNPAADPPAQVNETPKTPAETNSADADGEKSQTQVFLDKYNELKDSKWGVDSDRVKKDKDSGIAYLMQKRDELYSDARKIDAYADELERQGGDPQEISSLRDAAQAYRSQAESKSRGGMISKINSARKSYLKNLGNTLTTGYKDTPEDLARFLKENREGYGYNPNAFDSDKDYDVDAALKDIWDNSWKGLRQRKQEEADAIAAEQARQLEEAKNNLLKDDNSVLEAKVGFGDGAMTLEELFEEYPKTEGSFASIKEYLFGGTQDDGDPIRGPLSRLNENDARTVLTPERIADVYGKWIKGEIKPRGYINIDDGMRKQFSDFVTERNKPLFYEEGTASQGAANESNLRKQENWINRWNEARNLIADAEKNGVTPEEHIGELEQQLARQMSLPFRQRDFKNMSRLSMALEMYEMLSKGTEDKPVEIPSGEVHAWNTMNAGSNRDASKPVSNQLAFPTNVLRQLNKKGTKLGKKNSQPIYDFMNEKYDGNKTLAEIYNEARDSNDVPQARIFKDLLAGSKTRPTHPAYTRHPMGNWGDLHEMWYKLMERFPNSWAPQSPEPDEEEERSPDAQGEQPFSSHVSQETDDSDADESQEEEPDELGKLIQNTDALIPGSLEAGRFEREFGTDLQDGTNLFRTMKDNEYEMDLSEIAKSLKDTAAGQKYGDRLEDVLYAIQDYLRANPQAMTTLKAMPSIEDLMDSEFTL